MRLHYSQNLVYNGFALLLYKINIPLPESFRIALYNWHYI